MYFLHSKADYFLITLVFSFLFIINTGSIVEREGNNVFNTCTVYDPNGQLLSKYRQVNKYNYKSYNLHRGNTIPPFVLQMARFTT